MDLSSLFLPISLVLRYDGGGRGLGNLIKLENRILGYCEVSYTERNHEQF